MQHPTHADPAIPARALRRSGRRTRVRHGATLALMGTFVVLTACSKNGDSAEADEHSSSASAQHAQAPSAAADPGDSIDWKPVDQAMGRSGTMQPGGVHKYSMPRSDLHVTANGVVIKPALALGSWLAMKARGNNDVVAMGDLVLTQDEVNPVITKLQDGGVMQTALHNHLLHESPRMMYLHIHGEGDPVKIAQAVHDALGVTRTPGMAAPDRAASQPLGIDTAAINRALGHSGNVSGGVYHVTVPRPETIKASGIDVPPSMGTATSINFQPTGGGKAAVNGDFVMTASEVNKVIHALRQNGIEVVALHNHLLMEEPRLFFMHYWANDDAVKLAYGLRQALDQMQGATGGSR